MRTLRNLIRDLPVRRKLTFLLLTPCLVVLLLTGAALLGFQMKLFRADFARDMTAVAEIVGANSSAAIVFRDEKTASEILNSLKAKEYIVSAVLVLPDGTVFAKYGAHLGAPVLDSKPRFIVRDRDALMVKPILVNGKQLATLNVVSDYRMVHASLMKLVGGMLVIVVIAGAGVAMLLSSWLQRLISDPLLRLTRTAQTVAERNDYSVRTREESGVELGVLTRTFNQMLARIQEQDEAITLSQQRLEALIHSIDGIVWECAPENFQFVFVSRQSERLLGYKPEEWLANAKFWQTHLHPEDTVKALQAGRDYSGAGKPYSCEYRMIAADGGEVWIRESGAAVVEHGRTVAIRGIFLDITAEKKAAAELEALNRRLLEASRVAGMAEVATGVLHNVGNVLNSVSVSATLVSDRLKNGKVRKLCRATAMLRKQNGKLAQFLTRDPKGQLLPEYLGRVSDELATDQSEVLKEVNLLTHNIEHIKEIVAMQQTYSKVSGVFETLDPTELSEDALRMNSAAFDRHHIEVVREYGTGVPRVRVDRHKALQILINVLRNAKYAMDAAHQEQKRLVVRVEPAGETMVAIRVRDNGIGIAPENLTRIFGHGFTTKKDGHGFGLHSGANAAREMRGQLIATSEGLGKGAEFSLELPISIPEPANSAST